MSLTQFQIFVSFKGPLSYSVSKGTQCEWERIRPPQQSDCQRWYEVGTHLLQHCFTAAAFWTCYSYFIFGLFKKYLISLLFLPTYLSASVTPSPSAPPVRLCPPLCSPEDVNINLFTAAGFLSYIQSTTRRAYQQVIEVLDDNHRRWFLSSLSLYFSEVTLFTAFHRTNSWSWRRIPKKIHEIRTIYRNEIHYCHSIVTFRKAPRVKSCNGGGCYGVSGAAKQDKKFLMNCTR